MNSYSKDLLKENNQLQEITWDLKIQVDLLENSGKEMAKCTACNYRVPASTGMSDTAGWRGDGRVGTPLLPWLQVASMLWGDLRSWGRSGRSGAS